MNKSFNTFRAFAFLSIFLFHAQLFQFGYLGVPAFFVLSGYLITPILLKTQKDTPSLKEYFLNFYGRRAFRIFPPYYLYLAIVTLIIFLSGNQSKEGNIEFFKQLPWAIIYTYDFYHVTKYFHRSILLTHFWSLAVEEQFYIFFPFLFFSGLKSLKNILIILIVSGPFIRFFLGFIIDQNLFHFLISRKDLIIYVLPFSHIDLFAMGGFFSLYGSKYKATTLQLILGFLLILLTGLTTSKLFTGTLKYYSLGYTPFMQDSFKYVWAYSLFGVFFSLFLVRLNERDFCIAIFENNILNYLGKISYGLYIYHFAILRWVTLFIPTPSFFTSSSILHLIYIGSVSLIFAIIVSILSFELFEKYFLHWKDKFFQKNSVAYD